MEKHPGYEIIPHPEFSDVTVCDKLPGAMRIWPHLSRGDGHFCVHLRKVSSDHESRFDYTFATRKRTDNYSFNKSREALLSFMKDILKDDAFKAFKGRCDQQFVFHKNKIHLVPVNEHLFDRLKVVKMGHFPGEIKETFDKRIFLPSHCLAISLVFDEIKDDRKLVLKRDDERLFWKNRSTYVELC